MSDRWTAETEELVTDTLMQGYGRLIGRPGITHETGRLLTALADAGLLLPPGGETRHERGKYVPGTGGVSPCTNRCRQESDHTHDRERTVHTGPWVAVSET